MKWSVLLMIVFSAFAQAAEVKIIGSESFNNLVNEAVGILPAQYLERVSGVVTIEEAALKGNEFLKDDLCNIDQRVTFGLTKGKTVKISSKLVQSASNPRIFNCGHRSFKTHLLATIIHELTHVKDNEEKISTLPDFQRIVGMKRVQRFSKKKVLNQNAASSPDAYEFENLEESLGVNTEYFILDPEFECRKPATANFLSKVLGVPLRKSCEKNYKIIAQSSYLEDNYQYATAIDPKRIYQVHYLFAGKGQAIMSRWGHAMFRLVVCAPFRKIVGPECMDDVSHHLALTYRAAITDLDMSYSKGMFGKYPSQLFIMRFLEIQQEYTKYDLRDLYSVPVKMSRSQMQDFIDLTLERYWTYQGKYYFFDNNCGTEAVKHLAFALDEKESSLINSITPLSIYKDIVKNANDLSDGDLNGMPREVMIKKQFLIESMSKDLNETFVFLKKYLPSYKGKDLKKFIELTSARERHEDYESLIGKFNEMNPAERKQIILKITYLERYLTARFTKALPQRAMELMDKNPSLKAEVLKMGQGMQSLNIQPWQIIKSRYGSPLKNEFENEFTTFVEKRKTQISSSLNAQMENLQNILGNKVFEKELNEIEEFKKIKIVTNEMIKFID